MLKIKYLIWRTTYLDYFMLQKMTRKEKILVFENYADNFQYTSRGFVHLMGVQRLLKVLLTSVQRTVVENVASYKVVQRVLKVLQTSA
jgi:hypothetical protein